MCTTRGEKEMEAGTALHYAMCITALHKILRRGNRIFPNKNEALQAVHTFFATAFVGTLRVGKEEREKLLPGGIGLSEAVSAYGYMRAVWESDEFAMWYRRPKTDEQVDAELTCYLNHVHVLANTNIQALLTTHEQEAHYRLLNFCICAEPILMNIARSKGFELRGGF